MTRIGEALRRVREGGTADAVASELAPPWVQPALPSTAENVWSFEPSAPGVPAPDAPYPDEPVVPPSKTTAADGVATLAAAGSPLDCVLPVNPLIAERIISSGQVPVHAVEHYRRLAATLHEAQRDRSVKVVMITSALVGEGKSLTATNLALTLSESYQRRVLLVDADLRRPGLHTIFQVSSNDGLSDGLRRARNSTFTTFQVSSTLTMMPAGRPDRDPMASLTSPRMTQLIAEARHKFDWVIIDTPPVTLMPDAKLLAGMTDSVLLVVAAGAAAFDVITQAVKAIGRKRILGVIFNRADSQPEADYYQE